MVIRIGVIQDIAVCASIGVAVVAFTDLMLLILLMSYSGISTKTIEIVKKREAGTSHPVWSAISKFATRKYANTAIVLALLGLVVTVILVLTSQKGELFGGMFLSDSFASFFHLIFLLTA